MFDGFGERTFAINNDKYELYGSKNKLQIKNLISIRENRYNVRIIGNTFFNNSVVKGLIYIENYEEQWINGKHIIVFNNTFQYTATFYSTSVLFIRT